MVKGELSPKKTLRFFKLSIKVRRHETFTGSFVQDGGGQVQMRGSLEPGRTYWLFVALDSDSNGENFGIHGSEWNLFFYRYREFPPSLRQFFELRSRKFNCEIANRVVFSAETSNELRFGQK